MNSKNYAAYRRNIEKQKQNSIFDNLVVGEIIYTERINNFSISYVKENAKFIFQKVKENDDTKYIEVFSGMVFNEFKYGKKQPFVVNEEPLLDYINLDSTNINNLNLVEISDQINSKDKEKELVK